jgi:hypothetical protein
MSLILIVLVLPLALSSFNQLIFLLWRKLTSRKIVIEPYVARYHFMSIIIREQQNEMVKMQLIR